MKLVCIKVYNSRAEAELAKGLLKENGIKAMVVAIDTAGQVAWQWAAGQTKLFVREKDVEEASRLLQEK